MPPDPSELSRRSYVDVEVSATVTIMVNNREPIERVTGPNGNEWRAQMYPLHTEPDVLKHWACAAVGMGVMDVCQLDGWADVSAETVTFHVTDVEGQIDA